MKQKDFIDNNGALLIKNSQEPLCHVRQMDVRHFALQNWIEKDLLMKQLGGLEPN